VSRLVLAALVVTLVVPSTASARDSAARKLGRALANTTLGVLALPGKVVETSREHGPFVGVTWGLVKGTGYVVATELVGVFELFTAPFETPPDFKPILEPEFPWQHFTAESR
jgi:putative exosortase-associated protein (TIGR04073 family)